MEEPSSSAEQSPSSYSNTEPTRPSSNHFSFTPGDKVVKQRVSGDLKFGFVQKSSTVTFSGVEGAEQNNDQSPSAGLYVYWEDQKAENLTVSRSYTHSNLSKIGIYDRILEVGTRVIHQQMEGFVTSTSKLATVVLSNENYPDGIVFSGIPEALLQPVFECKVGDSVIHGGWLGQVVKGEVEMHYKFADGAELEVMQDLETVQDFDYCGKYFYMLPVDLIQKGQWTYHPLKIPRSIFYRNKPCTVIGMTLQSLQVFWFDRIRPMKTKSNERPPPDIITGRATLNTVFGLENPTKERLFKNAVFMLRWDDNLIENYENWKEAFMTKYLRADEGGSLNPKLNQNRNKNNGIMRIEQESFFKRAKESHPYTNRNRLAVKVLFYQTEAQIMFMVMNGTAATLMAETITQVFPQDKTSSHQLPLPFPDKKYCVGDIVMDKMDFFSPEKYGFILGQDNKSRTVKVKWILWSPEEPNNVTSEIKTNSQYDIVPCFKYQPLKMEPQFVVAKKVFEGVIIGLCLNEGKVKVQCAEGPLKLFWPHELEFCCKKVYFSKVDQRYSVKKISIPDDDIPLPLYVQRHEGSAVLKSINCNSSGSDLNLDMDSRRGPTEAVVLSPKLPQDHTYYHSDHVCLHPGVVALLGQELSQLREALYSQIGHHQYIWVQRFEDRVDAFTVAFVGPSNTPYQEVLFFLDFNIPSEYPDRLPAASLRLSRVYDPSWVHPLLGPEGNLILPQEIIQLGYAEDEQGHSGVMFHILEYVLSDILCTEPYLGKQRMMSYYGGLENQNNNNQNHQQHVNNVSLVSLFDSDTFCHADGLEELRKSRDFNEAALIAISEYIHAILCQPPLGWKQLVESHFDEYLPRIFQRCGKLLRNEDDDAVPSSAFLIQPTSQSFEMALSLRLEKLKQFLPIN